MIKSGDGVRESNAIGLGSTIHLLVAITLAPHLTIFLKKCTEALNVQVELI